MTKRDIQAAEYAEESNVSDEANKRWKTAVTNTADGAGVVTYTLIGHLVKHYGRDYVQVGSTLQPADGWHTNEADALRDAAPRVAEIHAAIGAQLARLLRGER